MAVGVTPSLGCSESHAAGIREAPGASEPTWPQEGKGLRSLQTSREAGAQERGTFPNLGERGPGLAPPQDPGSCGLK